MCIVHYPNERSYQLLPKNLRRPLPDHCPAFGLPGQSGTGIWATCIERLTILPTDTVAGWGAFFSLCTCAPTGGGHQRRYGLASA